MTIEQEFESQGFKHSFLHGVNPQEFIWHVTSGCEGCSDENRQLRIYSTKNGKSVRRYSSEI